MGVVGLFVLLRSDCDSYDELFLLVFESDIL